MGHCMKSKIKDIHARKNRMRDRDSLYRLIAK